MLENNQKEIILLKDLGMLEYGKQGYKARYGIYKCYCGNEFKTKLSYLKNGNTTSCGCYNKQKAKELNHTHGLRHHRLYRIFQDMKNRCYNKNRKAYKDYGGRGITVYNKWLNDFKSFYDWAVGNGYQENLTIDRIDTNGNYKPNNCRWVTREIQNRNTRKIRANNTSGYRGVSWHKIANKWVARICVNSKLICLGYFDTALDGALVYDDYIVTNNLEHTRNFS